MTIYFPPNENGNKRSYLNTGDNMKESLTFYAVYGWLDIDTSAYIGTYDDIEGTMYCGFWYQYSCNFDEDDWICENSNDYCNNPPTPHISSRFCLYTLSVHTLYINIMENAPIMR